MTQMPLLESFTGKLAALDRTGCRTRHSQRAHPGPAGGRGRVSDLHLLRHGDSLLLTQAGTGFEPEPASELGRASESTAAGPGPGCLRHSVTGRESLSESRAHTHLIASIRRGHESPRAAAAQLTVAAAPGGRDR